MCAKKEPGTFKDFFPYPSKHDSLCSLWSNWFSQSVSETAHKGPSQTCLGIQSQDEVTASLIQQYCLSQDCTLQSRQHHWLLRSNVSCSTARIPAIKILIKSVLSNNQWQPSRETGCDLTLSNSSYNKIDKIYFWNRTLHVSVSFSASRITCRTYTCCCVYSAGLLIMDRETVQNMQFYSKNKSEKLVHLVGFIIRIYHDAWSSECQTLQ
jgi:hypothetical protein